MGIFCPNCGNELAEGARFCGACGQAMTVLPAQGQQSAQPVQQQVYQQPQQMQQEQVYQQPQQMQQPYMQQAQPFAQPQPQQMQQQPYMQQAQPYAQQPQQMQQPYMQQAPYPGQPVAPAAGADGYPVVGPESSTLMRVISYLWILWLIPLFAAKTDRGARYHCNQGIVLFIVSMIVAIIGWIAGAIGTQSTVAGLLISGIVGIINIIIFVLMIIGIINAVKGRLKPLPIIGGITILK